MFTPSDSAFSGTPRVLTPVVLDFCRSLVIDAVPTYLAVDPVDFAVPRECFDTVDRQIELNGGERILGWRIWECPQVFIEAEFHAVWRAPEGDTIDIQQVGSDKRTLFVTDSSASWDGVKVDNVRRAILDHPLVHRLLASQKQRYEVLKGRPVSLPQGVVETFSLSPVDQHDFHSLVFRVRGRNDPCVCGSGRKFKRCHGLKR